MDIQKEIEGIAEHMRGMGIPFVIFTMRGGAENGRSYDSVINWPEFADPGFIGISSGIVMDDADVARNWPEKLDVEKSFDLSEAFEAEIGTRLEQALSACHGTGVMCVMLVQTQGVRVAGGSASRVGMSVASTPGGHSVAPAGVTRALQLCGGPQIYGRP